MQTICFVEFMPICHCVGKQIFIRRVIRKLCYVTPFNGSSKDLYIGDTCSYLSEPQTLTGSMCQTIAGIVLHHSKNTRLTHIVWIFFFLISPRICNPYLLVDSMVCLAHADLHQRRNNLSIHDDLLWSLRLGKDSRRQLILSKTSLILLSEF